MRTVGYLAVVVAASAASAFAAETVLFQFEQQAQQHCPGDSVVWADTTMQLYTVKGERWYGATKSGSYICLRDGEKAGFRARRTARSAAAE